MSRLFGLLSLFAVASLYAGEPAPTNDIDSRRSHELRNLLHQDCGSCHGMRLTGGLGPALTVDEMENRPRQYLIATIRDGRPGTPMPPWKNLLSEDDIDWLVTYLQTRPLIK